MKIFGDNSITNLKNSFINLTKKNYQTIKNSKTNLNVKIHDLKKASFGDKCKYCFNNYNFHRSIEIGHIFNLETKYSKPMNLSIINKYGNSSLMRMGCYGIGISRTISAIIEQNNDENGILWPISISPFNVSIMPIKPIDKIKKICNKIYQNLKLLNIDVIYDNRSISYAKKLKDNDLIGIPIQIIIGKNYIKKNKIQIKIRKNNIKYTFDSKISIIINKIMELLNN
jgi:prolyl-tRNA synthetase